YPVADVWPCHHLIDPDVARAGLGPDGTRDLAPLSSGVLVDDLPAGCNRDAHGSPRVHGLRRKASRRRPRTGGGAQRNANGYATTRHERVCLLRSTGDCAQVKTIQPFAGGAWGKAVVADGRQGQKPLLEIRAGRSI